MRDGVQVIKLGGSLLTYPALIEVFQAWRTAEATAQSLLIVGGGAAADAVREFDQRFGLSAEAAHWAAIAAMEVGAMMLASRLPCCRLATNRSELKEAWASGDLAVLSPLPWLRAQGAGIRSTWDYTSDSIAAFVASQLEAQTLVLLKSTFPSTQSCSRDDAARHGLVDPCFLAAAAPIEHVQVVNLRSWPHAPVTLSR